MRTVLCCLLVALLLSGCAGITGLATGVFTGAVDLPAEMYRHNQKMFEKHPVLYGLDALVLGPLGMVTGPLLGFGKGVALDVQWLADHITYGEAFGTYGEASVWRPHTLRWPTHPDGEAEPLEYE